jgi:hypothetical protein
MWRYSSIQDSPGRLYINDITGERKQLKRLEVHQANEMLRVYLSLDGNLSQQFEKMRGRTVRWADNLQTGALSKDEVWLALRASTSNNNIEDTLLSIASHQPH